MTRLRPAAATTALALVCVAVSAAAQPETGHPRLFLRSGDLPRLRSWTVDSNTVYREGLATLAARAKADMDARRVPEEDPGTRSYVDYPTEMYAELFAFLSLVSPDATARDDYAQRARRLLMVVMDEAARGPAAGERFRDPEFATADRSRWQGEAFALTVDWIYPYLTAQDKATIRSVFLRWVDENLHAATTTLNHPEPIGVVNDPVLLSNKIAVRWSANNYYGAHMRNIGLMAMALDPADDPGNTLRDYLRNATGAWLYVLDHLLRTDSRSGLEPEGFEYSPQSVGYLAQFLFALQTAGQDDTAVWGRQVALAGNPFWDAVVPAFLHSLSPETRIDPDRGPVFEPAWYGACQNYLAPDFIAAFAPIALHDMAAGNIGRLEQLRWIQTHAAPGAAAGLTRRARDSNFFLNAILYFMFFDPAAATPADPRPSQSLTFFAPGIGRLLARTGWDANATWFTYALGWNSIDHQNADGNQIELYRRGEWLTKQRTGYDVDFGASDNHNTVALENDPPEHNEPGDYRAMLWRRGSQWLYSASGDPTIVARSSTPGFLHVTGDATALYNSPSEGSTDIEHASRSLVWLKPDHVIVYDRARSKRAGRFKRFWLNFPTQAAVSGKTATMTTTKGQRLYVSTLLPANAALTSEPAPQEPSGDPANGEAMKFRLKVEAPDTPASVRFLHVLQGADAGTAMDAVTLVQSSSGTPYAGAVVKDTAILFPVDLATAFTTVTYSVASKTSLHLITGLTPNALYDVSTLTAGNDVQVTIRPGTSHRADPGGVLAWRRNAPIASSLYFPRLVSTDGKPAGTAGSEYTGLALANLGSENASITFAAFDTTGFPVDGPNVANPASVELQAGKQLPIVDSQLFGSGLPVVKPKGWILADSTVSKLAGFFLIFNQNVSILDGADVSATKLSSFVLPEIEDGGFTQIHVANPNSESASLTFELLKSDGAPRASSVVRIVGAWGAVAELFSEMFPGVAPSASDYLRVTSTLGVVPFEFFGKAGRYVEGLNGQDAGAGAATLYAPQYVTGGPDWLSLLSIVNLDNAAGTVTLRFISKDGAQLGVTRQLSIAARGKVHIADPKFFLDPGNTLLQGYVEITTSGVKAAGSVVFGDPGRSKFASALPLVATLRTTMVFSQVASDSTYFTGLALLNPGDREARLTIEVYDSSGVVEYTKVETIPARQRKSELLTQYFPGLAGKSRTSGYIKVTSDVGVACFALFGTNDLSALSAIPGQPVVP